MYAQYFGLRQNPFSIAPDPHFLFMTERHREALAHLLYGLRGTGGFVLLTGEIGAGKTTVCRCFLEQVPIRCNVAYIFNPKLTVHELLKSICDEFGIPTTRAGREAQTVKDYLDPLNEFLLRSHAVDQSNMLIIDEAQNLSADVLEQLRLLTNLETDKRKLLQIVLIGQPELRALLARPGLEQLAQRIVARFHLDALTESETAHYIKHRLAVAGMSGALPFDREARKRIHDLAHGVPRRINQLCDRAMLGAYATGKSRIDRRMVDKAAYEVFDTATGKASTSRLTRYWALGILGLVLAAGATVLAAALMRGERQPAPRPAPAAASPPASSPTATPALSPASTAPTVPAADLSIQGVDASGSFAASAPDSGDHRLVFAQLTVSEHEAWRQLAPLWGMTIAEGDPCEQVQRNLLHCFRGRTVNLALIRQLDRPGILTLRSDGYPPAYALLVGLDGQRATLRLGSSTSALTVSLATLARHWRGEYATLWRPPVGYTDKATPGGQPGATQQWLAQQLTKLDAQVSATQRKADERPFKDRLFAFQLSQGLAPDGIAGPITFMQINRALGVDEPRLQTHR